ncbi:MAG TPA: histone deacetylase family protein [Salinisphaeraceae bacterium]|nr:histone deacetylase family protein [Salinisphaeraceae bacterium]
MTTAYYSHPSSLAHDMGTGHPECPQRLQAVARGLADADLERRLVARTPTALASDWLQRLHDPAYIDALVAAVPEQGLRQLDGDTAIGPHSLDAALHAAGAAINAVDEVMSGQAANAFCAMRPPGHHAERSSAMGFCLFGNVAAGAVHALEAHGLERVAIVDFDVHHGNGTEDVLRDEPRVLFCSSYQNPLFPNTDDTSIPGQLIKTPLRPGTGSAAFRQAIERDWLPAVDEFRPQLILVSAGFDADRADPLADLQLETKDFAWVTERICELATSHCHGRIVSMLEGGYDLAALAAGVAAHVSVLLKHGE